MKEFKGTKGEWHISSNGDISGDEHPICSVQYGVWGDSYPTLKIEGLSLERKCVPVMEMIEYGEIPKEESEANSNLIAAAPDLLEALKDLTDEVGSWLCSGDIGFGEEDVPEYLKALEVINKALGK